MSWYDHPQYYDLGFQDETEKEVKFLVEAFKLFADGEVNRIYEPGCGTGRLVHALAKLDYDMVGLDMNANALEFLAKRLKKSKLEAQLVQSDMTDYVTAPQVDAAINTFNTFRHLLTEADAVKHLESVAKSVRPGGIYVLGFHLLPPDADESAQERWRAKQGKTEVCYTLRVTECDRRKRLETLRVSMLIRRNGEVQRTRHEFPLRLYTAAQVKSMLAKVPQWQLGKVFDFWYDLEDSYKLNNEMGDVVLILHRQADN